MSDFTPHELLEIANYLEWKVSQAFVSGQHHESNGGATKDRSYKCTIRRVTADLAAKALREYANELSREKV